MTCVYAFVNRGSLLSDLLRRCRLEQRLNDCGARISSDFPLGCV